jgi:hypothetical protein
MFLPSLIASFPERSNPLGNRLSGQAPFNCTIDSFCSLKSYSPLPNRYRNTLCIFIIVETNLILFFRISRKLYWTTLTRFLWPIYGFLLIPFRLLLLSHFLELLDVFLIHFLIISLVVSLLILNNAVQHLSNYFCVYSTSKYFSP